ncbi:M56 family metallopeptidase [Clostridium sediminicola]|uniref:M56 family metallopeptidase n=1 Tax=Clostridium sediminicola TaxID=3114879 RepID=UPI003D17C122
MWIARFFISFSYLIFVYLIFIYKIRKLEICKNKDILHILNNYKNKMKIKNSIEIVRGGESPMAIGFIKPKILIPYGYKNKEIEQILIHELCHIKYKDVLVNISISLITCLYWFNPIIWIASIKMRQDMEMLCDQRVLNITKDKKLYATVLLHTALNKKSIMFYATSMENGEKQIKRRIKMIVNGKKTKLIYTVIAAIVLTVVGITFLTNKENKNVRAVGNTVENKLQNIDGIKEFNYDKITVANQYSVYDEELGKAVEKFSDARPISNKNVMGEVVNNLKGIKFTEIGEPDLHKIEANLELTYDITFYENNEEKGNIRFYDLNTIVYKLNNKLYINDSIKNDYDTIVSKMENIITLFKPVNFD